jgi:multidrug transporter EmrE-like cation transporter
MLKAFCPVIILIVMFIFGVGMPNRSSIACAVLIVIGTLVEVRGELSATLTGVFIMLLSECSEAVCLVLGQMLLQNHKFTVLESMYFLAGPSALILSIPAAMYEWPRMVDAGDHALFVDHPLEVLSSCTLGVGVNFLSFFVVQLTNSATLKILNTVRCIGMVVLGVVFFGETVSFGQVGGYAMSLVGFVGYNYFQLYQDKADTVESWVGARCGACIGNSTAVSDCTAFQEGDVEEAQRLNSPAEDGAKLDEFLACETVLGDDRCMPPTTRLGARSMTALEVDEKGASDSISTYSGDASPALQSPATSE